MAKYQFKYNKTSINCFNVPLCLEKSRDLLNHGFVISKTACCKFIKSKGVRIQQSVYNLLLMAV